MEKTSLFKRGMSEPIIVRDTISTIWVLFVYPSINMLFMREITTRIVSLNIFICALMGIVLPVIWERYSEQLTRNHRILYAIDISLFIMTSSLVIFNILPLHIVFIMTSLNKIPQFIIGNMWNRIIIDKFDNKDDRERFDNSDKFMDELGRILGGIFATIVIFDNNIELAFILMILQEIAMLLLDFKIIKDINLKKIGS